MTKNAFGLWVSEVPDLDPEDGNIIDDEDMPDNESDCDEDEDDDDEEFEDWEADEGDEKQPERPTEIG